MHISWLVRKRGKMAKFLCILVISCVFFGGYYAHKSPSMFGEENDVCQGAECRKPEPDPDTVLDTPSEQQMMDRKKEDNEIPGDDEDIDVDIQKKASDLKKETYTKQTTEEEINVLITFTNAEWKLDLQQKFTVTVSSLLKHSTVPLAIHVIGDTKSQTIANRILTESSKHAKTTYRSVQLDVDMLAKALDEIVRPMQDHFSYKPGAYYNHALFFLSIAIHRVMPAEMKRVIMLDADLKFMDDIKKLYDRFELFTKDNILGIAHEKQPVYRHTFWQYRRENPGTRVGDPPPDGLTGFNSGVLLLDLDRMRNSKLYNSMLTRESLQALSTEFMFKGHLGDQDFFSLLSMKYEVLFHVLPCEWNRQLCNWWSKHGYAQVFDLYYKCAADIKIYHGNCNTPIP